MPAARQHVLDELRERISALEGGAARLAGTMPFGVAEIDAVLPRGGLAFGTLHEFAGGGAGTVDGAAAALCAAGIAARTKGPIVWCLTRPDLFFPALAQVGLHPDPVIFVESDTEVEVLANMEEGLVSTTSSSPECKNCTIVSSSERPFRHAPHPVSDRMISQPAAFRRST